MHSDRIDSFFPEDEHFFGTYESEPVSAQGSLAPLEFDVADVPPPTGEQLAHFNRFRRPVAGVIGALATLSVVAFAAQGARREAVNHEGTVIAPPTSAAVAKVAAITGVPHSSTPASSVARASAEPWSWAGFAASVLDLVLEPSPPSASVGNLRSPADSAAEAGLVDEFTSVVMSVCRKAPYRRSLEARW